VDPWTELGLDADRATLEEVRAVRRRLAKRYHPDLLVTATASEKAVAAERLARVNVAVEICIAHIHDRDKATVEHRPMPAPGPVAAEYAYEEPDASFGIDLLPIDAFELVLLAFSAIGDPKVVDEPYLLEGQVDSPYLGHARVTLAPVAGGSQVTVVTVPARAGFAPPAPGQVASLLLYEVKALRV
jgi:hypothetical protein